MVGATGGNNNTINSVGEQLEVRKKESFISRMELLVVRVYRWKWKEIVCGDSPCQDRWERVLLRRRWLGNRTNPSPRRDEASYVWTMHVFVGG